MNALQTIVRNRNKLALVVGCARRLSVPFHRTRPKYVAFAMAHSVDVALELFVGVERHILGEVVIAMYGFEKMVASVFR